MINIETRFGHLVAISGDNLKRAEIAIFKTSGKPHAHDDYEICVITEGDCWLYIEKSRYYVGQGDVIIIPPKLKHWHNPEGTCKAVLLYSDKPLTLHQYGHTKHRFIVHKSENK